MDSVFGISGDDWAIVASDSSVMRSIFKLKVSSITTHSSMIFELKAA